MTDDLARWIEFALVLAGGLSLGLTLGSVVTTRYWATRARTREPIVTRGERFVVLPERDFFDLCRKSRS